MSRRPPRASAIERYASSCSSSPGGCGTVEEEEFGAQQPHSVGAMPHCLDGIVSTGDVGEDLDGDAVGGDRRSAGRLEKLHWPVCAARRPCSRYCSTRRGSGSITTTPSVPSTRIVVPSGTRRARHRPAPTTAGIPRARARIAPWESGLPAEVTMPSTVLGSSRAAWVGVRSSVTTMPASMSVCPAALTEQLRRAPGRRPREHRRPGSEGTDRRVGRSGRRARRRPPARHARP